MERFCPTCGSLVQGDGDFCPSCGAKLGGAVNLEKPITSQPTTGGSMPDTSSSNLNNQSNQSSNYSQMPNYPQNFNSGNYSAPAEEMSVGQWVLTIFLSGLGIIGIILLFVWAFGSDNNTARKNYARAMLIWEAIALGLIIIIYGGLCMCGMSLGNMFGGSYSDIYDNLNYYTSTLFMGM